MNQRRRIQMKIILVILLAVMLFFFLLISYREHTKTQPSGEMVKREEAEVLIRELSDYTGESEEALWEKLPQDTLREDWYNLFDQLLTYYQAENEIIRERFSELEVYTRNHRLLAIRNKPEETVTIPNAYIEESGEDGVVLFYRGSSLRIAVPAESYRDGIADVSFQNGTLYKMTPKEEMVCGKILQVTENEIVLEGLGSYGLAEDVEGYQTCEELRNVGLSELAIGYDFTDFVMENDLICGYMVSRKEQMQTVRVVIHNSNYNSLYHQSIELSSEQELLVTYEKESGEQQEYLEPGKKLCLSIDKSFSDCSRIKIGETVNTGKIQLLNVERSQGTPTYRGDLEIFPKDQGLVVINEVPLEEYLYAVVPSEMPASYPEESLKAQAVCARTYAYGYLLKAGLPELGAHMDDSVNYQVYNNILEKAASTNAVRETTGELLFYGEDMVHTYYYSTSCGFGTDAQIWTNGEEIPYLKSTHISGNNEKMAEDMVLEEEFRAYLTENHESDYEREEPWYRWRYTVEQLDTEMLYERMKEKNPKTPKFHEVYGISEGKRNNGGILTQLLLETDQGEVSIEGEYNIRYVLNQGGAVIRQDDSEYVLSGILPSAYFYIVPVMGKKELTGFQLVGGGFGHGVGMSQNGAKQMAIDGRGYQDILNLFYQECKLAKMY